MSRALGAWRAIDGVIWPRQKFCTAFLTSFSLSPLEMTGRHALATCGFGFPNAQRLIKSSDGMKR
jgi:hypothetical protein